MSKHGGLAYPDMDGSSSVKVKPSSVSVGIERNIPSEEAKTGAEC